MYAAHSTQGFSLAPACSEPAGASISTAKSGFVGFGGFYVTVTAVFDGDASS